MIYQKIRPTRFDAMVGQSHVVKNIQMQAKNKTWFQVYILGGQYGSGKTTMARIIAMAANCENPDAEGNPCGRCSHCLSILSDSCVDYREIDGASNTGIDNIRSLKEYVEFIPMVLEKKIVIIDEVHMLSNSAFNSLLKLLEEPPAHVIFILATTDVEKIPATVRSRSACYTFGRISTSDIKNYLLKVAAHEQLVLTDAAASVIARKSDGAMRNALKLLEQVGYANTDITEELVLSTLGLSEEDNICKMIYDYLCRDIESIVSDIHMFEDIGKNFYTLSDELLNYSTDLLIIKCKGVVEGSAAYLSRLSEIAEKLSLADISRFVRLLDSSRTALRLDSSASNLIVQSLICIDGLNDVSFCKDSVSEPKAVKEKAVSSDVPVAEPAVKEQPETASAPVGQPDPDDDLFDSLDSLSDRESEKMLMQAASGREVISLSKDISSDKENGQEPDSNCSEKEIDKIPSDDLDGFEFMDSEDEAPFKEADTFNESIIIPAILKDPPSDITKEAEIARESLIALCREVKAVNTCLSYCYSIEYVFGGIVLSTPDVHLQHVVAKFVETYDIKNIKVFCRETTDMI